MARKFTAEEKAAAKAALKDAEGEKAVLESISKMAEADREMATRIHAIVRTAAPELTPRTWYGMPAYSKNDKVICFFKDAGKFKERYATFGFNDKANLDDGSMWPTSYALTKLTKVDEKKIGDLVAQAVS
ncbi:MAG TPA: DUF1801 domain-containing protein [Gaiellaceae bacterium]|jgi:uncharacterized protein YdhG (YjbR/CyaY superfamily)